jgi:periplasmic protein TonB
MIDRRLAICAVLSLLAHFALARGLERLPKRDDLPPPQKVEVRVIEPAPPPEPPKPEEPKPDEPKVIPHEAPRANPVHPPAVATVSKDAPPSDKPAFQQDPSEEPVYGYKRNTTSQVGTGPAVPVGNTTKADPGKLATGPVQALAEPVAAAEATKLPLPEAQCFGKYTDEALAAGVEGYVIMDVIVGENGEVRSVDVTQKLPNGLTEAAMKALKQCRFTPGERDGKRVPVRIRGFKVHFVLPGNN